VVACYVLFRTAEASAIAIWERNVQVFPIWKLWQAFFGILNRHDGPLAI
jgi:hypothetical protein